MSLWLLHRQKGKWQIYLVPINCALGILALICWALGCAALVVVTIIRSIFSGG